VLEARHGADALLVWAEHHARIDAVVTDLRMPELGGRALVARLHALRPGLPVVYMSGYADEGVVAARGPREAFVEKPFTGRRADRRAPPRAPRVPHRERLTASGAPRPAAARPQDRPAWGAASAAAAARSVKRRVT
jgi:CheY-like chemotaxis protein